MEDPPTVLAWVERLGGWAVVLLIVRWMMSRIDKLIEGFSGALKNFQEFEIEERRMHGNIIETQDRIIQTQEHILDVVQDSPNRGG